MRDDADHPVPAVEGAQSADDNVEGVGVQGTEAFRPSRRIRVALGGQMSPVKEEAKRLIDELPDTATWDDVMYELYVKMKIARGVAAAEAGDVVPHEEAKRRILAE
jgi:predicted transcriptional regulator